MKLKEILVSQAYQSPTNPRGKDFAGESFDDFVASVKEKVHKTNGNSKNDSNIKI